MMKTFVLFAALCACLAPCTSLHVGGSTFPAPARNKPTLRLRGGLDGSDVPKIVAGLLGVTGVQSTLTPSSILQMYKIPDSSSPETKSFTIFAGGWQMAAAIAVFCLSKGDLKSAVVAASAIGIANFLIFIHGPVGVGMGDKVVSTYPWLALQVGLLCGALNGHEVLCAKINAAVSIIAGAANVFAPVEFLKAHSIETPGKSTVLMFKNSGSISVTSGILVAGYLGLFGSSGFSDAFTAMMVAQVAWCLYMGGVLAPQHGMPVAGALVWAALTGGLLAWYKGLF